MTSFAAALPYDVRQELKRILRERAADWQRAFFTHDMLIGRTVRGLQLEAVAEFERLVVRPLLKSIPQRLAGLPARTGDLARDLMPEVLALQNEIERTVQRGADAVRVLTETRMVEIAKQEVRWLDQTARRMDPKFGAHVEGRFGDGIRAVEKPIREQTWLGDSTERWFAKDLAGPTATNVRRWITTGVKSGMSTDEIVRGLKGTKTQSGLLSEKPRHTVEALVRTASTHASAVGRLESFKALGVTHYMFRATLDQRTSLQCASEDGNIYLLGEGPIPPLHPNCFPGDTLVSTSAKISGVSKRWVDGELITIRTASGRVLSGTPNHPVLTDRGWVGIGFLAVGDHVVSDGTREWGRLGNGDDKDVPTTIHEVAEAFLASSEVASVPVPVSAPDFHGDGANGEVAVVGADRRLRPEVHAAIAEHRRQIDLVGADVLAPALGPLREFLIGSLNASHGRVCGRGEAEPLRCSHPGVASQHPLRTAPQLPSMGKQYPGDGISVPAAEPLGDGGNTDPAVKQREDRGDIDRLSGDGRLDACESHLGAAAPKVPVDGGSGYAELANQIIHGGAGMVFRDEVSDVDRHPFSGWVYNLETESGFYHANGIVVHNCRSVAVPVSDPSAEPRGQRASIKGRVLASTTFEEWLATIPRDEQDMVLGKTKAAAWRNGKLTLRDMLGNRMQPLTLAELREMERI